MLKGERSFCGVRETRGLGCLREEKGWGGSLSKFFRVSFECMGARERIFRMLVRVGLLKVLCI